MYGEVKQSKLKEEEKDVEASDAVSASAQTSALLHSRVSGDDESYASAALRDRGTMSTFGKVVPHQVHFNKQELIESSDYDNTTIFNYNNNISPSVTHLPRVENALRSDIDKGSAESECSLIADMTSNSALVTMEANLHSPSKPSDEADEANMDLDSVIALLKSMASSDDTIPAPVQRRSSLFEHRTHAQETLKPQEDSLMTVRQHTNTSSSDPPNLISTEKTSIHSGSVSSFSQSDHFEADTSVDDEKPHSATPFRLNSSSEVRLQGATAAAVAAAANGTSECLSPETDASLTPVSASSSVARTQMLQVATKAEDNSYSTIGLDHYYIHENTKYSDPSNLDKSSERPNDASFFLSGIFMQPGTGTCSTRAQETTTRRTSENCTYSENAVEDSICKPYQRTSPHCFTPEVEECPTLTSSRASVVSDSSNVNLVGDVAGGSIATPADQFKALRLDVLKATSKLLDFVGEIWRRQESLHGKLSKINLLCLHLKTGLQDLENFGLGLISHLSEEERQTLEKKLFAQMKLLQNIRDGINRYLESLERETLSEHMESSEQWSDESLKVKVGNIILLTKVIPGLVRTFGSFVDDIVKADFSNKPVDISETDKTSSSGKHLTKDSRAVSPDLNPQDRDLTRDRSDFDMNRIEANPPAIPPKLKTMSDSKILHENKYNFGEDHVRTVVCYGSPSYNENTMLVTVNLSGNDSSPTAVRQVSGELKSSVAGEPLVLQSKNACRPYSVTTDPSEGTDSCSLPPVVFRRKSPISPALQTTANDFNYAANCLENRFSTSELVTPDIRASGISLTVQTKLEELQRQATSQNVLLHTDADCSFMDYDLPAGIMEENLPNLCEFDCKLLLYYSDEMLNHWKVLDSAASAFFQCMEMSQFPKVFIMHSKFVIVAGHKMAYIGDVLARNVTDNEARHWLLAYSNELCERLKHAVRTTKGAALAFPAVKPLQLMVDAIKEVTDSGYELRELLFRLAYLGRAEQSFSW